MMIIIIGQLQIHNVLHISNLKVELQFVVCACVRAGRLRWDSTDQGLGMLRCVGAACAL